MSPLTLGICKFPIVMSGSKGVEVCGLELVGFRSKEEEASYVRGCGVDIVVLQCGAVDVNVDKRLLDADYNKSISFTFALCQGMMMNRKVAENGCVSLAVRYWCVSTPGVENRISLTGASLGLAAFLAGAGNENEGIVATGQIPEMPGQQGNPGIVQGIDNVQRKIDGLVSMGSRYVFLIPMANASEASKSKEIVMKWTSGGGGNTARRGTKIWSAFDYVLALAKGEEPESDENAGTVVVAVNSLLESMYMCKLVSMEHATGDGSGVVFGGAAGVLRGATNRGNRKRGRF